MKIGIIVAVTREFSSFLGSSYQIQEMKIRNHQLFTFNTAKHQVYVMQSGCGLIDAASATQFLISELNVDLILNYGVTGALDPTYKVDDLFIVTKVVNHDYDTSAFTSDKKCQYSNYSSIYIPMNQEMIDFAKSHFPYLKEATAASGNFFIEDRNKKKQLFDEYHCHICDMEVASIARVCDVNKVKVLSIKSISDTFDGDGKDFEKNVVKSAQKAFNIIEELIKIL